MKFRKILSSEQGFTLVELMIAGAIISILMVVFASYMYQQQKQSKDAESKQSYAQLKANVLEASSKVESLSKSESLKFSDLGTQAGIGSALDPSE